MPLTVEVRKEGVFFVATSDDEDDDKAEVYEFGPINLQKHADVMDQVDDSYFRKKIGFKALVSKQAAER